MAEMNFKDFKGVNKRLRGILDNFEYNEPSLKDVKEL